VRPLKWSGSTQEGEGVKNRSVLKLVIQQKPRKGLGQGPGLKISDHTEGGKLGKKEVGEVLEKFSDKRKR